MLVGYARVSTMEQNLHLQQDALKAAGCTKMFEDTLSGAREDRPGLRRYLSICVPATRWWCGNWTGSGARCPHLIETVRALEARGDRLQEPAREHRHDHERGQVGVPPLRRPCRVRARHHPRAHRGRMVAATSAEQKGRPSTVMDSKKVAMAKRCGRPEPVGC
jgi:hypothetical protein